MSPALRLPKVEIKVKPKLRGVSHEIAFFVAVAAAIYLFAIAPTTRAAIAALIYGLSLACMFGVSALYHRPMWSLSARKVLRRVDHSTIFLLVAGTYTPVCLLGVGGQKATIMLAVVWTGAVLGILHSIFFVHAFRALNAILYVVLSCAIIPVLPSFAAALGPLRTTLLGVGGAIYIAGAIVYMRRRPNPAPAVFGYHEVFHLMVIVAGALHYAAVANLVHDLG